MSLTVTERISPNNKPIISNLINVKKPIKTKPTAMLECASKPNNASPGNLVLFCKLNNNNAIIPETKNTDREILILKENANVTPKSAECDKVSPKYAKRRQMTKHPNGPVTIATPIPATKALTKKSSNIIFLFFHQYHEHDHDDAYIKRG